MDIPNNESMMYQCSYCGHTTDIPAGVLFDEHCTECQHILEPVERLDGYKK